MSEIKPMHPVMERVWDKARAKRKRIVLPEAEDERILKAAELITRERLANVILIGKVNDVEKRAENMGVCLQDITVIDSESFNALDDYSQRLYELRRGKIGSIDEAKNILLNDKLFFGAMMVKAGEADGMIAGAAHPTADVLRPAFHIIKTAPGISLASTYFAMLLPNSEYGENGFFLYADPGGIPNPTAEELADISITTTLSMERIFGIEDAYCAMLAYSTKGSASHPIVDKVIEATEIANKKRPDLNIDGELQADAAIVPEVGKKKAPESSVAGKANILIFPDLNSGNIAYKLTERLANAEAYGPLVQGLDKPINDLSRGCKVMDIVNVAAIVSVKADTPYGE